MHSELLSSLKSTTSALYTLTASNRPFQLMQKYCIWPSKRWAEIDARSTHFYKTRFVLQWLGMVETDQTVSLGQWDAEES